MVGWLVHTESEIRLNEFGLNRISQIPSPLIMDGILSISALTIDTTYTLTSSEKGVSEKG